MAQRPKRPLDPVLLARARELRTCATNAERLLWYFLRKRGLEGLRFRRQEPIGRYIVDFYCHAARLAVELDGGQHATRIHRDAERTDFLESRGLVVLRFWNDEVLGRTEEVLQQIHDVAMARIAALGSGRTQGAG